MQERPRVRTQRVHSAGDGAIPDLRAVSTDPDTGRSYVFGSPEYDTHLRTIIREGDRMHAASNNGTELGSVLADRALRIARDRRR